MLYIHLKFTQVVSLISQLKNTQVVLRKQLDEWMMKSRLQRYKKQFLPKKCWKFLIQTYYEGVKMFSEAPFKSVFHSIPLTANFVPDTLNDTADPIVSDFMWILSSGWFKDWYHPLSHPLDWVISNYRQTLGNKDFGTQRQ